MPVTRQMEDYLGVIYRHSAQPGKGRVGTGEVARALGVSSASATYMFKRLRTEGLVEYEGYAGVRLTRRGAETALALIRNHRLTERFLSDVLDIAWDRVDRLAHEMEHALPTEVTDRIDEMLGYPATCPHGHPIPAKDHTIREVPSEPLAVAQPGECRQIVKIENDDPAFLRHVAQCQLIPGREVRVLAKNEVDGIMTVEVGSERSVIDQRMYRYIEVKRVGASPVTFTPADRFAP